MVQPRAVLVVEDQIPVRGMMVRALADVGYRVLEAGDGIQALEILAAFPEIALIVTDVVMPRMDGFELATEVGKRSRARMLFTSGYGQHHRELPPEFLQKPFTPAALVAEVTLLLNPTQNPAA
jgi:CheY-like chemotaxis protein